MSRRFWRGGKEKRGIKIRKTTTKNTHHPLGWVEPRFFISPREQEEEVEERANAAEYITSLDGPRPRRPMNEGAHARGFPHLHLICSRSSLSFARFANRIDDMGGFAKEKQRSI
ncbi:PREDICTED: uncharacterized protein LOC108566187 [Nicrophorus vespilloides]|uniref:Uncharacterized protein LOC108566187 n=1 Tax=Nicrophorus vespilloides TaxID=110193 RepID=A0ABM1N3N4_NICVS|nr:PREDICTED: uncharacterized protein LOC108566187 [Nicrophorus vespilloides]